MSTISSSSPTWPQHLGPAVPACRVDQTSPDQDLYLPGERPRSYRPGPLHPSPDRNPVLKRQQVVDFILQALPEEATLDDVLQAVCRLGVEQLPHEQREWLEEIGDEVPGAALIHGKRLPAVPTRPEVLQLLEAPDNPRDRLIIRLLYATGMRVGELTALVWADVRPSDQTLFIRAGKEDKDRYALADPLTFELLAQFQRGKEPSERVIPLSSGRVEEIVKDYAARTGLLQKYQAQDRHLTPHSFRHAFATHCYENGMDLLTIKALLGHEDLGTTEGYIQTGMQIWRPSYLKHHVLAGQQTDDGGDGKTDAQLRSAIEHNEARQREREEHDSLVRRAESLGILTR